MECDIEHIGLSQHFPAHLAHGVALDELKARVISADALLLSTPVYFGDRSSVAHDLIQMIRSDSELKSALTGKVYAGISVGAKRNGGQETSLIYQLLDMTGAGLLGVGNDSDTTSQYGGTAHGGDVGTVSADDYGLGTSVGVGRRIGHVAETLKNAEHGRLRAPLRVHIWLLQDCDEIALREIRTIIDYLSSFTNPSVEATLLNFTDSDIHRCIACDICPTHVDTDEAYRCIIHTPTDALKINHSQFLEPDAIMVAGLSQVDTSRTVSTYQRFMERTRYLRRGDYVLSDVVVAPLVIEELGAKESLSLRMLTSMLRHHTIMTHPIVEYLHRGAVLNREEIRKNVAHFISQVARVTTGRCVMLGQEPPKTHYNPVGYVLSTAKDQESKTTEQRKEATAARTMRQHRESLSRVDIRNLQTQDVQ